jgi:amidophosphoribosyltransferase
MTYYGLHALQHRGQEAAGIVTSEFDKEKKRYKFNIHKDHGLVLSVFSDPKILTDVLKGESAIGHTRYSTTGSGDNRNNIQPLRVNFKGGHLAVSHNGNFTNTRILRNRLEEKGTLFQTTTDSELALHLIARSNEKDMINKIIDSFRQIEGAYSICILTDDKLFAIRDPHGVRPMSFGKLDNSFVFASETCAFDIISADYIRDVQPGEVIMIDKSVLETGKEVTFSIGQADKFRHCIFEYIYFARPDSMVFEEKVDKVRRKLGKSLAEESPAPFPEVDEHKKVAVINVPDSSNTATLGYFNRTVKSNKYVKHEIGLIRSHYVGRTFIQPGQDKRKMKVKTKFNTVRGVIKDRKIVMIDDSIVRGTTSKLLVELISKAEPKEIHLKITSPPVIAPCYYGMDFPSKDELIANQKNGDIDRVRDELGLTTLHYLSFMSLENSVPYKRDKTGYCTACFSGEYPIAIDGLDLMSKHQFDD